MKLTFPRFLAVNSLILSAAFLLSGQTSANAQQQFTNLTPAQTQRLSRDLFPSSSQDFFKQGNDLIEREIQILRQRKLSSTEPVLKIDLIPRVKKGPLPSNRSKDLSN